MIQDSGNRREFESGAVRDIAEGKGRCDLLPLDIIGTQMHDYFLKDMGTFIRTGRWDPETIDLLCGTFGYKNRADMLLDLSKHYEDGCLKYGERNWEKGIPLHCFIDSAIRHYLKYHRGDKDERHDRAVLWNTFGALWTLKHHPELNDLPFADKENHNE